MRYDQVASNDATSTGSVHTSSRDRDVWANEQVLCVSVFKRGQYVCVSLHTLCVSIV